MTRTRGRVGRLAWVTLLIGLFVVPGCDDDETSFQFLGRIGASRSVEGLPPFYVDSPEKYRKPGVYDDFYGDHKVYLRSYGGMLVALYAKCTYPRCDCFTRYDDMSGQYKCPCDGSRFDADGLAKSSSPAEASLRRCRIERVERGDGVHLRINPGIQYLHEYEGPDGTMRSDWSNPYSMHVFDR